MADIHIERPHAFGLAGARALAVKWTEEARSRFAMTCTAEPGSGGDTIHFERSGVTGTVRVEADRFTLDAKLGFLMSAFSKTIEAEITKNLDALLATAPPMAVAAKKKPVRKAASVQKNAAKRPVPPKT